MSTEHTTTPAAMRLSFKNIKYFLVGVLLDGAVVGLFFLYLVLLALLVPCDQCTFGQYLLESVWNGLKFGAFMSVAFLIYFWFILIPAFSIPPIVGLLIDCKRMAGRDAEGLP